MTRLSLIIPLLALAHLSVAQFDQYGVIYPEKSLENNFGGTFFPETDPLMVFSLQDAKPVGKLERPIQREGAYKDPYTLLYISAGGDTSEVDIWSDMREVGYEQPAITFSARKKGLVKIMDSLGDLWVKTADLTALGFRAINYQDFMVEKSGEVLGFYPETSLNLRKSANASGEKIETLGDLHEITLTGEHNGQWSKVKVIKLKEGRCQGGQDMEEYELEGWIKVIDDSGNLNIWYFTRGC